MIARLMDVCGVALPWAILFVVQSSALALAAWIITRVVRSSATRNVIWRSALVGAMLMPMATVAVRASGLSLDMPVRHEAAVSLMTPSAEASFVDFRNVEEPKVAITPSAAQQPSQVGMTEWIAFVGGMIWAIGAVAFLGYLAIGFVRLRRMRSDCLRVEDEGVILQLEALAERLNAPVPAVLLSERVSGPLATGVFLPAIILPSNLKEALFAGKVERFLLHELAHLARRDCAWNLATRLFCAVSFFNPFAWLLARQLEESSEDVADDMVLTCESDARLYATDLADAAERFVLRRGESAAGVGVIGLRSNLRRRVARIMDGVRRPVRVSGRALLSICVVIALLTGLLAAVRVVHAQPAAGGRPGLGAAPAPEEAAAPAGNIPGSLTRLPGSGAVGPEAPSAVGQAPGIECVVVIPAAHQETDEEKRLKKLMKSKIPAVSMENVALKEAIDMLRPQKEENINFRLDPHVFDQGDVLVNVELRNVTLEDVLAAILYPNNLNFLISRDSIFISATEGCLQEEAREENLSLRRYDISALVKNQDYMVIVNTIVALTGAQNWDLVQSGQVTPSSKIYWRSGIKTGLEPGVLIGVVGPGKSAGRVITYLDGALYVNHVERIHQRLAAILGSLSRQAETTQPETEEPAGGVSAPPLGAPGMPGVGGIGPGRLGGVGEGLGARFGGGLEGDVPGTGRPAPEPSDGRIKEF